MASSRLRAREEREGSVFGPGTLNHAPPSGEADSMDGRGT
jgi:hypothetical protein